MGRKRNAKRPLFSSDAAREKEGYRDIRNAFFPVSKAKDKENQDGQCNQIVNNRCATKALSPPPSLELSKKLAVGHGREKKHRSDGIEESATTTDSAFASAQPVTASKNNDTEESFVATFSNNNVGIVVATTTTEAGPPTIDDSKPPARDFRAMTEEDPPIAWMELSELNFHPTTRILQQETSRRKQMTCRRQGNGSKPWTTRN